MTEDDTFDALNRQATEDEIAFGRKAYVYCRQHLRPHMTGWCSVNNNQKIKLESKNEIDAFIECQEKKYTLLYK